MHTDINTCVRESLFHRPARGSTKSPQSPAPPSPQPPAPVPARAHCITMSANDAEGPLRCYHSRLPDHDRVVGASGHAAVAAAIRRRGAKPHVRRRLNLPVVPSPGARDMDERPPQQDDPAGDTGQRQRPISRKTRVTLKGRRYRLRAANGEYFITESFLTGKAREHKVEYTLGSRRIQHYLTTIDNGRMVDPAAKLGRAAAAVVPQHGDRPAGRARPDARPAVEQELRRLPRQPAGEQLPAGDANLRDQVDRLRHVVRAVPRARERARRSVHATRSQAPPSPSSSIVRPTRLDPKTSSMICAQCHSLRDVIAPGYTAGADYYDYFLPLLEYRPQKARRSRLLGRRAAAPLLERRDRPLAEPVLPAGRRDLHQLPPRPARCPTSTGTRSWRRRNNALCTRCHQKIGAAVDGAHAPRRAGAPAAPASSATCRRR